MVLKNYEDRLGFLNRNIDKINKAVSNFLGFNVNFAVRTFQRSNNVMEITLVDDSNIKDKCGVMSKCFEWVHLADFGIWWDDDVVYITIDCNWRHIGGGSNGTTICKVYIVGDEVSVRSVG